MKEFLLFIRTQGDHEAELSPEQAQQHVQKMMNWMGNMMKEGKVKGGNALEFKGKIISGSKGTLKDGPFNETKEIIGGYIHFLAKDLDEAVAIAKTIPILEDGKGARIEVRPLRMMDGNNG